MTAQETIKVILDYLDMTPAEFSKCLGLDNAQSIYYMQNGTTKKVSRRMASAIKKAYPAFNEGWLLHGEGTMLERAMSEAEISKGKEQAGLNDTSSSHVKFLTLQVAQKDIELNKQSELLLSMQRIHEGLIKQLDARTREIEKLNSRIEHLTKAFEILASKSEVGRVQEDSQKDAM